MPICKVLLISLIIQSKYNNPNNHPSLPPGPPVPHQPLHLPHGVDDQLILEVSPHHLRRHPPSPHPSGHLDPYRTALRPPGGVPGHPVQEILVHGVGRQQGLVLWALSEGITAYFLDLLTYLVTGTMPAGQPTRLYTQV